MKDMYHYHLVFFIQMFIIQSSFFILGSLSGIINDIQTCRIASMVKTFYSTNMKNAEIWISTSCSCSGRKYFCAQTHLQLTRPSAAKIVNFYWPDRQQPPHRILISRKTCCTQPLFVSPPPPAPPPPPPPPAPSSHEMSLFVPAGSSSFWLYMYGILRVAPVWKKLHSFERCSNKVF